MNNNDFELVRRFHSNSDELIADLEKCTIQELLQKFEFESQAPLRRGMKNATYKRVIINKLVATNNKISKFVLEHQSGVTRRKSKLLRKQNIGDLEVTK